MKWEPITALTVVIMLSAVLVFVSGCTEEEMITASERVSATSAKLSAVTPAPFNFILAAISAIAGAVPPVALAIRECRRKNQMKKAIIEKGNQVDKIILASKGNPEEGKSTVLDFFKSDMRLATGDRLKALNDFDKVRKGYL